MPGIILPAHVLHLVERLNPRRTGDEVGEGSGHMVLSMRFEDYVGLFERTGRRLVEGKQGISTGAALPVLETMGLQVG